MDSPVSLRFAVVANANSGAASLLGEVALDAMVTQSLGPCLHTCEIAESEFIDMALDRAFSSPANAVVVIGGDGTCRAAAKLARHHNKLVAFLPGGTMNLLPSRHWPGMDLATSLQALGNGAYVPSHIDVGLANDDLFLIAAAFGAAPALARLREAHRASDTFGASIKNLISVPKILPHLLRPSARLEAIGVSRHHLAALALVIGDADFALGRPETDIEMHMIECVRAEVTSPLTFLAVMLRALFDPNWRDDTKVTTSHIKEGKVYSKKRMIAMTLDGEVVRLTSPAHIRLVVNGLEILVHAPLAAVETSLAQRPAGSPDAALVNANA